MGYANVDWMLDEMTPRQFSEWVASYKINGHDAWRVAGMLEAAIHNQFEVLRHDIATIAGSKPGKPKLADPGKFTPGVKKKKRRKR